MSMAVRELTLADHAMVDELREAVGADLARASPDWLAPTASGAKAFLAASGSFMFGAYVDHDVAGGVWGHVIRHPDGAITVQANELYVLAGVRRRGIGSLLVESAMGLAKRSGAQAFELRSTRAAGTGDTGMAELCASLGSTSGPAMQRWAL